jgi:hypothetical protein
MVPRRMRLAIGASRSPDNESRSLFGEWEPGANPGQACCCNGHQTSTTKPLQKREGVEGGRSQKTGRAGSIVLTVQEAMQPKAPTSAGFRLRPFMRDLTGSRLLWESSKETDG